MGSESSYIINVVTIKKEKIIKLNPPTEYDFYENCIGLGLLFSGTL
jgi:hypothetical protein